MPDLPTPILDLRYLIEACDGDANFIKDVIGDYLNEMPKYLAELDASLGNAQTGVMLRAAHTIKGASANIGAARVRETASRLESQAKKGAIEGSNMLVRLLHKEIERVRDLVARRGVDELLRAS
jgi:HPt (histidine-containing phosphotransfer) domain-containing protein